MHIPSPIAWNSDHSIRILDQTRLPGEETYRDLSSVDDVAEAIRTLRVRGAPLIGIAAAMGVVLPARPASLEKSRPACTVLGGTSPTAVNLHWALRRMCERAEQACAVGEDLYDTLLAEANA